LHPSGRIYISHHVEFNPAEFPYIQLFSSPVLASLSSFTSGGLSTIVFQSLPLSKSSRGDQPVHSSPMNTNSCHVSAIVSQSNPVATRSQSRIPNPIPASAPSIHPMQTWSKTKLLASSHLLLMSLLVP